MKLKNNKNIVIKEEDKGGIVVIMCTKHYCKIIYDHLDNKQIYKRTDSTCDTEVMDKIKKLTQKDENILTKLEIDYLTNFSTSASTFYGLPKIQKSALISEAIAKQNNEYVEVLELSDLKLRSIVPGPTCH